jgi:hypothetical protein
MAEFGSLTGTRLNVEVNSADTTNLYTTALRDLYVNEGVNEFAALTKCYVRRAIIPLSCGTTEVVLSTIADYAEISEKGLPEYWLTSSNGTVTILAGEDFVRRDELWLNRQIPGWRMSTGCGMPSAYYLRPDGGEMALGFDLRPDVARPQTMSASTSIPFTDTNGVTRSDLTEYHQAFSHYAAYKLLPLAGDYEGAKGQLALFMDYVKRCLQNMRPKGGTHVTLGRDYLRGGRRVDRDGVPVTQWS